MKFLFSKSVDETAVGLLVFGIGVVSLVAGAAMAPFLHHLFS